MNTLSQLTFLAIAVIFAPVARTQGASGELGSPSVAFPARLAPAAREKIYAVLQRKGCTFISGSFLNKDSQLHYKSDTESLGKFLEELSQCSGAKIHIGFYRPGPDARWAVDGSNWSVFHSAADNSFSVKVRLGSDIDLTTLYIPPLASAPGKKRKAKVDDGGTPFGRFGTDGIGGGKPADAAQTTVPQRAHSAAHSQPDKEGIYWSKRSEDQWVAGMKVIQWPTPASRKLIVEFMLRNDAAETREVELDLYRGNKSSLFISEGNRADVDLKETRHHRQTTAAGKVATFDEGRAEINFEGLEAGNYTLRFKPVIYLRKGNEAGRGIPFDVRLPVPFDDSYDSLPIHWGKPVAGLRIGAMFRNARKGEVHRFNSRDVAKARLFIQNVSPKDVDCGFDPPYHGGWGLRLADSTGRHIEPVKDESSIIDRIGILVPRPTLWACLAPGEIQPLNDPPQFRTGTEDDGPTPPVDDAQFSIVPANDSDEVVPAILPVAEYIYILSAREYSVRVGAVLRKKDSPDAIFSVESGPIPFRVDVVSDNAHRDSGPTAPTRQ